MATVTSDVPQVVVVGGGLAGTECARQLARHDVRVTLVDKHNYSQFQPMLYQVATAQVEITGVARPLREMFKKKRSVDVKMAEVTEVDPVAKSVTCTDGTTFSGDFLVLAMGAQPNFFHIPGAEAHTFPLYGLIGAERLRSRLFEVFEDADRDPRLLERGALNIVIIGAGATGVEIAGALADLVHDVLPTQFHDLDVEDAEIYLVEPASVVLAPFSERAHAYAAKTLERKGVKLELGVSVREVQPDRVVLSDGREILTRTVVWAGGITASRLAEHVGISQGAGGRIDVDPDLTVHGFDRVYALGDVANIPGPDGKCFPQLGSVALQAGRSAAGNIIADIEGREHAPFHYHDKGIMAMIGRNAAIAEMGPRRRELHGVVAYASWLVVHVYLLTGFRERMSAVRNWAWDYFTKSRAVSIIDRLDEERIDWGDDARAGNESSGNETRETNETIA